MAWFAAFVPKGFLGVYWFGCDFDLDWFRNCQGLINYGVQGLRVQGLGFSAVEELDCVAVQGCLVQFPWC